MVGLQRPNGAEHRQRDHRNDPITAVGFTPLPTVSRWLDEMRLAYGSGGPDRAQKIVSSILVRLVPIAVQEERERREKEEQERKEREERQKRDAEEQAAKEKAEVEEKAKQEAEEARLIEERAATERAAEEERAAADRALLAEVGMTAGETTGENEVSEEAAAGGDAMEGVEATQPEGTQEGPSDAPQVRATVMIRGRDVDITGMDIDPEFLEALPDDMREEVLTQHIRERQAASSNNDQPSEISREFLEALPDDIRAELIQQEQADQRRREREQQRAASGQPRGPADIDLASFLATLDPGLRQTVLLEQNDEALAQFPDAIAEEAHNLRGDRQNLQRYEADYNRIIRSMPEEVRVSEKKVSRKGMIQMLDKAGVATLLRLMFIPQQGSTRMSLHEILLNVCENRQNRGEVISLLLSILQDGSADMAAVEKSFAHLSVRAKQASVPKTPQSALKRSTTNQFPQTNSEMSPLLVVQQCLGALAFLVNYNETHTFLFLKRT